MLRLVLVLILAVGFQNGSALSIEERLSQLEAETKVLKSVINSLTRQVMLQQMYSEESVRGVGHSGVKQVRLQNAGTQSYHSESHVGYSQASIHDHNNYMNTCGLGEMSVILNGIEFRTRHNDYKLVAPHSTIHGGTKEGFDKTETIEFPGVPPQVSSIKHFPTQVKEMRYWFRAWRDSNKSKRDYSKYFIPLICYLEGAWHNDADSFEESFESERHSLDASSWEEMQDKVRFTSYTGRKSNLENFAALPKTIAGFVKKHNISVPVYAQWNYRILCHKVKAEVPLYLVHPVDDFSSRMMSESKFENFTTSRAFRYRIGPKHTRTFKDQRTNFDLLDYIMQEIPGKDNYPGESVDNAFGYPAMKVRGNGTLNASYYHRWYKSTAKGAMGRSVHHRGYNDPFMFAAMTNSTKIAPVTFTECTVVNKEEKCETYTQRWSFAIPLELVYLTPLQSWNPHNLYFQGSTWRDNQKAKSYGKRNGGFTVEKAYNGTASKHNFKIPEEFFKGSVSGDDPADTGKSVVGVLDQKGVVQRVLPAGIRTLLPEIEGIGKLRTRFPIFPVYEEGSLAYKETKAIQNLLMNPKRYEKMYRDIFY